MVYMHHIDKRIQCLLLFSADKRPFQCDQCDYKAKTKPQLKVHVMRHSGKCRKGMGPLPLGCQGDPLICGFLLRSRLRERFCFQ